MATNCWRPEDMRRFLLVFTMTVSATGQSTNPTIPPTSSEEPNGLNKPFLIAAILLGFVVIILVYCCRRIELKVKRRRPVGIDRIESEDYMSPRPSGDLDGATEMSSRTSGDLDGAMEMSSRTSGDLDGAMEMSPRTSVYYSRAMEMFLRPSEDLVGAMEMSPRPSGDLDGAMEARDYAPPRRGRTPPRRLQQGTVASFDTKEKAEEPKIPYPRTNVEKMNTQEYLAQRGRLKEEEETDVSLFLYKEQYFDRNGGVLVVPEAEVSLSIPPGAITDGHIISVNVVPTNYVSLPGQSFLPRLTPLVICEPDGINFLKPVELILPHCGVIDDPGNHTVTVEFGSKERYFSRDMTWRKEDVKYKLTKRFCHIFLKHFSGVNVNISGTKEKILRGIPFASAIEYEEPDEDIIINMWLCNDLAADYLTLVRAEIKNKSIPLDSYDTFRLNTSEHQPKPYIEVFTEAVDGSSKVPEIKIKRIDVHGLATTAKSKCSFRYTDNWEQHDHDYIYATIKINQQTEENEKRETLFVFRKRMSDLTINSECLKTENPFVVTNNSLSDSGRPPSDDPPKSFIAVPFVDPMLDGRDDIILTLWLLSEESEEHMLSNFEKEQNQLEKIKLDTENTFTIRNTRKPVTSIIRFRKGNWKPISEKMEVELGKLLCGNRAKFPFICRKETNDTVRGIDVEITIVQEGETNQTEFMKRKRVDDFIVGGIKPVQVSLTKAPPGESSRKFEDLCKSLIDSLSADDCHYVATYFDFAPAQIEGVLSSNHPADTLIRKLRQRLLFTVDRLGWVQEALTRIHRNDLAETVRRVKMESQEVNGETPL